MISRSGIMRKKPTMTTEEFKDFWFYKHGPIAAQMKNLRHYEQHLVIDREQRHAMARGPIEIDAYSELYFDSIYDMEEGVASLNGAGTADLANFVEDTKILIFVKKLDTPVPEELKGKKLVKCMSLLTRAPGVSAQEFQSKWWGELSDAFRSVPGYVGYAQNIVIDRLIAGRHVPYEQVPVDGMMELWFKDMDGLDACLNSPEYKKISQEIGQKILGGVSTYLCETAVFPVPGEK